MRREPKRTDVRDAEAAMEAVRLAITERAIACAVDCLMQDAYLSDPHSGAYALPGLVQDLPGVVIRYLPS